MNVSSTAVTNGITAFLFSCTGPLAIILAVAASTGLDSRQVASWLFGGFAIAAVFTLYFSLKYRQPLAFAWTIPGTVLLLTSLDHLTLPEAVGAYIVTGILLIVIGVAKIGERIMELIPAPVVMAMVAGIFLDFGLKLIDAFDGAAIMAGAMVLVFILANLVPAIGRRLPPIMAALLAGGIVVWLTGSFRDIGPLPGVLTHPVLVVPSWSWQAMVELVIPLTITVLMVQNAQGYAVLTQAGHRPPQNRLNTACGVGSILLGLVGAVSMCVTGPSNAILSATGRREQQYQGAVTYGILAILFGVFSTLMTWLALALPTAYIAVLGGLAVYRVLEGAFIAAFANGYTLGALTTLLITVSDVSLFNIGAPFWGLVGGTLISKLLEQQR